MPVFLEFADAADNLGGAFSFHFEATKGRWGLMTDLNFIRLASSADFAVGPLRDVEGDFELDNVTFELGGLYLLNEARSFGIIGGLRTYTLSPKIQFTGSLGTQIAPLDDSQTSPNAFVGVVLRPRINDKWTFIGRADIGGGDADLTWSAVAGLEDPLQGLGRTGIRLQDARHRRQGWRSEACARTTSRTTDQSSDCGFTGGSSALALCGMVIDRGDGLMRRIVSVALVAGLFAVGLALPALTAQNSPAQDAGDSTRPGPTRRFPPSRCIRQGGPSESTRAAATATSTKTGGADAHEAEHLASLGGNASAVQRSHGGVQQMRQAR